MAEEMIVESDEAEDWESDEAIAEAEAEDTAEDIGERARRWRGQRGRPVPVSSFRRMPGVRGIALRRADGTVQNLRFPSRVATAAATNSGLAKQEIARRALGERLDLLEQRLWGQQKKDTSAAGVVTLLVGGGLTAWGVFQASKKTTGSMWGNWANETSSTMAAVTSVSQIATSGAKLAINGRYHRSGFGIAADVFAAAQLAAFAFGSLYLPKPMIGVEDRAALQAAQAEKKLKPDHRYLAIKEGEEYETFEDSTKTVVYRLVNR